MPETALRPQNGAEGLYGGAGKHCYGKYNIRARTKKSCRRACAGQNPAHTDRIPASGIQEFSATARLRPPAGAFFSPAESAGLQNFLFFPCLRGAGLLLEPARL